MHRFVRIVSVLCALFIVFGVGSVFVGLDIVSAETGCAIPDSGPWPPCATGDAPTPDCIIPDSGPWPPCASGGSGTPVAGECVIPASGPWPPCGTGSNPAPISPGSGCAIPESGPWPPCASGGNEPAENAAKTRVYAPGELRDFFVKALSGEIDPESDAQPLFADDSAIKIENDLIIISGIYKPYGGFDFLTEAAIDVGSANGEATLEFAWLIISSRIDETSDNWMRIESNTREAFLEKLRNDLAHSTIESVSVDQTGMTVIYQ